jgi:ABC-2 type transport system ATP-binding protein
MTPEVQAVQAANVTVRYGKKTAVDDVTLSVAPGSVYALLGRNGSGKSSLVRCLLGQLQPQTGHAELFGEDVWRHRTRLMERVGVVPEDPDAPPFA